MNTSLLLTATKEFTWDMAHMLAEHKGLCQNLHGHTYKMLVTVARKDQPTEQTGPAAGMVVDFKALKEIVNRTIVERFDHSLVLNTNSTDEFERQLVDLAAQYNKKVVHLPYRATAEDMARDFFETLQTSFNTEMPNIMLVKLTLYETPTSYAEVTM